MFSGGRARAHRSKKLWCYLRNTQHRLIQVYCSPPVLFHIYCVTVEVQWGGMCMEGSESIWSLLANPEFLREFPSPIKVSWPPERLIINTKYTSTALISTHCGYTHISSIPGSLAGGCHFRSAFCWEQSSAAPDTSLAPAVEWWLLCWLCLLLRGENTNNQGQEQPLQWITRALVLSGFAFSIPAWVEGQD